MTRQPFASVTDNDEWSGLDHFDEDICARVRIALLEDFRVQDFLLNASELNPNESLGYWHLLEELERLSDGFLTAQQGHLLCDRLREADDGQRAMAIGGIPTLWGALPPTSDREATYREGRRRWPSDTTFERAIEALLGRFPEPRANEPDLPGDSVSAADDNAAGDLTTSSVKVARHRLRGHLPQND